MVYLTWESDIEVFGRRPSFIVPEVEQINPRYVAPSGKTLRDLVDSYEKYSAEISQGMSI